MKHLPIPAVALAALLCLQSPIQAAVTVTISESGTNLLVTTAGTMDITNFSGTDTTSNTPRFRAGSGLDEFVSFGTGLQQYWFTSGAVVSGSLNSLPPAPAASLLSGGGDLGFTGNGVILWFPDAYVSGAPINQVLQIIGESYGSIGVALGDFKTITWDTSTGTDSITFIVDNLAVPEPGHALLLGLSLGGLLVRRRRPLVQG